MANKYLTFFIGKESYGLPILKVKEIIGMMNITYVPNVPKYVKGVINLRGNIIPALDLRLKFGFESRSYDDKTCIIVVEISNKGKSQLSGLIVDTVWEVLDIDESCIEGPPAYQNSINDDFLSGIGKVKDRIIMLIDADKILCSQNKNYILNLENK